MSRIEKDLKDMVGLEVSFVCPTCLKEIKRFLLNGYTLNFSGCSSCTGVTSCFITCPECESEIELLSYG